MVKLIDRDREKCYYLLEEKLADTWKEETHLMWTSDTMKLFDAMELGDVDQASKFLSEALTHIRILNILINGNLHCAEFVKELVIPSPLEE